MVQQKQLHFLRFIFLVIFPETTCKTSITCRSVCTSMSCQHVQSHNAPRLLGRRWWNDMYILGVLRKKTPRKQNFEFRPRLMWVTLNLPWLLCAITYTALCNCTRTAPLCRILLNKNPSEELNTRKFPASHRRKQSDREWWPTLSGVLIYYISLWCNESTQTHCYNPVAPAYPIWALCSWTTAQMPRGSC